MLICDIRKFKCVQRSLIREHVRFQTRDRMECVDRERKAVTSGRKGGLVEVDLLWNISQPTVLNAWLRLLEAEAWSVGSAALSRPPISLNSAPICCQAVRQRLRTTQEREREREKGGKEHLRLRGHDAHGHLLLNKRLLLAQKLRTAPTHASANLVDDQVVEYCTV